MRPAAVPAALFGLALALLATVPLPAAADTAKALFGAVDRPSPHDPNPIGRNAQGCLAGGVALPESGPTWQEMRLSRNHYWGDPSLIDFIARYTAQARKVGWQGLYIGDLSQPRGGPVGGHASHQTGLDVDIWLTPATRLDLTPAERETISAISVLGRDKRSLNRNWGRPRPICSKRRRAIRRSSGSSSPPLPSLPSVPPLTARTRPGCARSGRGGAMTTICMSG